MVRSRGVRRGRFGVLGGAFVCIAVMGFVSAFSAGVALAGTGGTGGISGTVSFEGPVPNPHQYIDIYQYDAGAGGWVYVTSPEVLDDGTYSSEPLTDGSYKEAFFDSNGDYANLFYKTPPQGQDATGAVTLEDASTITVSGGQVTTGTDIGISYPVTPDSYEPDNSTATAKAASVSGTHYYHTLSGAHGLGDVDYQRFRTSAGGFYTIRTYGYSETVLTLYDKNGTTITANSDWFDPNGPEWCNAQISFDATEGGAYFFAVTSGSGFARHYEVSVSGPAPPQVGDISGIVTDATGTALGGIEVTAFKYDSGTSTWAPVGGPTITSGSGAYRFSELAAGDYHLGFVDSGGTHAPQFYANATTVGSGDNVTVTDGGDTHADVSLAGQGTISGDISGDGTGTLDQIYVQPYVSISGSWAATGTESLCSGAHYSRTLLEGTYQLRFRDARGYYRTEFANGGWVVGDGTSRVIDTPGQAITANVALGQAAGTVAGSVTGAGYPVGGIQVTALQSDGSTWSPVQSTITASSGAYTIDLPTGAYRMKFSDPSNVWVTQYYSGQPSIDLAQNVMVSGDQTTSGIGAAMAPRLGMITGAVSSGGTPVVGIRVQSWVDTTQGIAWAGDTSTSPTGVYQLANLGAGSYRIRFYDASNTYPSEYYQHRASLDAADRLTVSVGAAATASTDLSSGTGGVKGTVTNGSTPLANIGVWFWKDTTSGPVWMGSVSTSASGGYVMTGLSPGAYRVKFHDPSSAYPDEYYSKQWTLGTANPVSVSVGVDSVANAAMGTGRIAGCVRHAGTGLPNVEAWCWKDTSGTLTWIGSWVTDSGGNYKVPGLVPGNYKLKFHDRTSTYPDEYYDHQWSLGAATLVAVTAGTDAYANADLGTGRVIGTVYHFGTPLPNIQVWFWKDTGGTLTWVGSVTTRSNGQYTMGGLLPGNYRIRFYDPSSTYPSEYYQGKSDLSSASLLAVTQGADAGASADLGTGRIVGAVTHSGEPLPNIQVWFWKDASGSLTWAGSVSTGADGTYGMLGLQPGNYRIRFYDASNTYPSEYYQGKLSLDTANDAQVTAGADTVANAALNGASGRVVGTVTYGAIQLSNVQVWLWKDATGTVTWIGSTNTDGIGHYTLAGLQPGNYRIRFYDASGTYTAEYYDDRASLDTANDVTVTAGADALANADLALSGP